MYRGHFEEITEMTTRLRNENGELKKRLTEHQAKNFSHSQENKFLRWENDTTKLELEKLKNELENKDKEISELRMEIITQKLAQQKLAQTTNAKLERVIQTTAQSTSTQLNSIKMQFEDREKEYGLTLTKIRNEMEFLQKELERRENQVNRLTHRLDELTIDNKKMLDINTELRHDTDDELAVLKSEISRYRNELDVLRDQNENLKFSFKENTQQASSTKERHEMVTHQQRLEQAQTLIRALRAQIYDLRKVTPQNLSDKSALRELQRSRLELAEIREKHRQVEKDCDEERQQRMDLTEILLEMSKDLQEIIQWSKILEA
ncbi:unnamed protein product, partial [Mesorhabditis belari]|uniref:Uncharacterized protein n=1 Tax=Mesorhabditis belari TaxID=2138241 RepID=A0AAF3FP57_9BILA